MTFDKEAYRKRRKEGKRGQGEAPPEVVNIRPSEAQISFSNDNQMVLNNREYRRRNYKLPSDRPATKKTKRKKKK